MWRSKKDHPRADGKHRDRFIVNLREYRPEGIFNKLELCFLVWAKSDWGSAKCLGQARVRLSPSYSGIIHGRAFVSPGSGDGFDGWLPIRDITTDIRKCHRECGQVCSSVETVVVKGDANATNRPQGEIRVKVGGNRSRVRMFGLRPRSNVPNALA